MSGGSDPPERALGKSEEFTQQGVEGLEAVQAEQAPQFEALLANLQGLLGQPVISDELVGRQLAGAQDAIIGAANRSSQAAFEGFAGRGRGRGGAAGAAQRRAQLEAVPALSRAGTDILTQQALANRQGNLLVSQLLGGTLGQQGDLAKAIAGILSQGASAQAGVAAGGGSGDGTAAAAASAAGSIAAAAILASAGACWLAIAVFGACDPRTTLMRCWIYNDAPMWFVRLYCWAGPRFQGTVSRSRFLKWALRPLFTRFATWGAKGCLVSI